MKKIILSAFALIVLVSCKKENINTEAPKNKIEYFIECENCTASFDSNSGTKTFNITGNFYFSEINDLPVITVKTKGLGNSHVTIQKDRLVKYYGLKYMDNTEVSHIVPMD